MTFIAAFLRAAERVLAVIVTTIAVVFISYGVYTAVYDAWVLKGAALPAEIVALSPENDLKNASENNSEYGAKDLGKLAQINVDAIGWLVIDGADINYPIMQGRTDTEYLNKDAYGDFSLAGSVFLSCTNSPDFSDSYSLIYGHHMENGAMFGALDKFKDVDFFKAHKLGKLYAYENGETTQYGVEFFALLNTDAYDRYVFDTSESISFEEREAYIHDSASIKSENSDTVSRGKRMGNIDISSRSEHVGTTATGRKSERIIALATCADSRTSGRTVLLGYIK